MRKLWSIITALLLMVPVVTWADYHDTVVENAAHQLPLGRYFWQVSNGAGGYKPSAGYEDHYYLEDVANEDETVPDNHKAGVNALTSWALDGSTPKSMEAFLHLPAGNNRLQLSMTVSGPVTFEFTVKAADDVTQIYKVTKTVEASAEAQLVEVMPTTNLPASAYYRVRINVTSGHGNITKITHWQLTKDSSELAYLPDYLSSPSVHTNEWKTTNPEAPSGNSYDWAYEEVMIPESSDLTGTYCMSLGVLHGYMGIQVNGNNRHDIIFSMWDNGNTDTDRNLPDYLRSGSLDSNGGVAISRFGGEGTGTKAYRAGQYWVPGKWVKFLTNMRPEVVTVQTADGPITYTNTICTAWYKTEGGADNETNAEPGENEYDGWHYIASHRLSGANTYFNGWYSFLENFDWHSGNLQRKAYYRNGSLHSLASGKWSHRNVVSCSHTDGGNAPGKRNDYGTGIEEIDGEPAFYMTTGGLADDAFAGNQTMTYKENFVPITQEVMDKLLGRVEKAIQNDEARQAAAKAEATREVLSNEGLTVTYCNNYSTQEGSKDYIVDGDEATYWHTNYGSGVGNSFPYIVDIHLSDAVKAADVEQIELYQSRNNNYRAKKVKVYYSDDNSSWTQLGGVYELPDANRPVIQLSSILTGHNYVRLEVTERYGSHFVLNEVYFKTARDIEQLKAQALDLINKKDCYMGYSSEETAALESTYANGTCTDYDALKQAIVDLAQTGHLLKFGKLTEANSISSLKAYTLHNVSTGAALVVKNEAPDTNTDEYLTVTEKANNWLLLRSEKWNANYLYNLQAQKYLAMDSEGRAVLTDKLTPVHVGTRSHTERVDNKNVTIFDGFTFKFDQGNDDSYLSVAQSASTRGAMRAAGTAALTFGAGTADAALWNVYDNYGITPELVEVNELLEDAAENGLQPWTRPQFGGTVWTWNKTTSQFDATGKESTATPARDSYGPVYTFPAGVGNVTTAVNGNTDTSDKGGFRVLGSGDNVTSSLGRWAGSIEVSTGAVATVEYSQQLKGTEPTSAATVWVDGTLTFGGNRTNFNMNDGQAQRWYIGEHGLINTSFTQVTKSGDRTWNLQIIVADEAPVQGQQLVEQRVTRKVMTWGADLYDQIASITVYYKDADGYFHEKEATITHDATGLSVTYTALVNDVVPIFPANGTYYVAIKNYDTARNPYLYNDLQYDDDITIQAANLPQTLTNQYIWKVTSDGNGTITLKNGTTGKGITPSGGNGGQEITSFTYTVASHTDYYYLTNGEKMGGSHDRLNCANNTGAYHNSGNVRAVTTWDGNHNDNEWTFVPVEVEGTLYNVVVTGDDRGYAEFNGQKAMNGGFIYSTTAPTTQNVSYKAVDGKNATVNVSGTTITIAYTQIVGHPITYKFVNNGQVWHSEEHTTSVLGSDYPDFDVTLPWGVEAVKPTGSIKEEDGDIQIQVVLSANYPVKRFTQTYNEAGPFMKMGVNAKKQYCYANNTTFASSDNYDENNDAYLWQFVGNPFVGYTIYNKAGGKLYAPNNNTNPSISTTGETKWNFQTSVADSKGFFLNLHGDNSKWINRNGGNGTMAFTDSWRDAGSTFYTFAIEQGEFYMKNQNKGNNGYAYYAEAAVNTNGVHILSLNSEANKQAFTFVGSAAEGYKIYTMVDGTRNYVYAINKENQDSNVGFTTTAADATLWNVKYVTTADGVDYFNIIPNGGSLSMNARGRLGNVDNVGQWNAGNNSGSLWQLISTSEEDITIDYDVMYAGKSQNTYQTTVKKGSFYPSVSGLPYGLDYTVPTGITSGSEQVTINTTLASNYPVVPAATVENLTDANYFVIDVNSDSHAYIHYVAAGNPNVQAHTATPSTTADVPQYKWAFVGDPFAGYTIYNKVGATAVALDATAPYTLKATESKWNIVSGTANSFRVSPVGSNGTYISLSENSLQGSTTANAATNLRATQADQWLDNFTYEFRTSGVTARPASLFSDMTLWYTKPAHAAGVANPWMEYSLPIGNGMFGASLYGNVKTDMVTFVDKTLWRKDGNYGSYQYFGELYAESLEPESKMGYNDETSIRDYVRYLDLDAGKAGVSYTDKDGGKYTHEYIASNPDEAVIVRYTASNGGKINRRFTLVSGKPGGVVSPTTYASDGGHFSGYMNPLTFDARFKVVQTGGTVTTTDQGVEVRNADEVLLVLAGGTDFDNTSTTYTSNTEQLGSTIESRVNTAAGKTWTALYNAHKTDYDEYYTACRFDIGGENTMDTESLVNAYRGDREGGLLASDLMLEQLYFAYGRYLSISSSRGGNIPNNLQGIWANKQDLPWHSDIHTNINVQMNYWPVETTNLSDMHVPFLKNMINETNTAIHDGWASMARKSNQNRGWTLFTESTIFGGSSGFQNNYVIANAWYATHLWQHYRYTLDETFLHEAFPAMLGCTQFWIDRLIHKDADDSYEAPNEWSPEHGPNEDAVAHAQQLVRELFDNTLAAYEVLKADYPDIISEQDLNDLKARREKLDLGLAIEEYTGAFGADRNGITTGTPILREWKYSNYNTSSDAGHRHHSHLMALYPFSQFNEDVKDHLTGEVRYTKEQLYQAALNSLTLRGDASTGWSMGWKMNLWARALDGDHTHVIIKNALRHSTSYGTDQSRGGIYYNLFDSHAPFQIDGNFGATAGMAECVLQSHTGVIQLLPALPSVWASGSMTGMKAVGNFTVSQEWAKGKLTRATIVNNKGQELKVKSTTLNLLTEADVTVGGVAVTPVLDEEGGYYTIACSEGQTVTIVAKSEEEPESVVPNFKYTIKNKNTDKYVRYTTTALNGNDIVEMCVTANSSEATLFNVVGDATEGYVISCVDEDEQTQYVYAINTNNAEHNIAFTTIKENATKWTLDPIYENAGVQYFNIKPSEASNLSWNERGTINSMNGVGLWNAGTNSGGNAGSLWSFEAILDPLPNADILAGTPAAFMSVRNNPGFIGTYYKGDGRDANYGAEEMFISEASQTGNTLRRVSDNKYIGVASASSDSWAMTDNSAEATEFEYLTPTNFGDADHIACEASATVRLKAVASSVRSAIVGKVINLNAAGYNGGVGTYTYFLPYDAGDLYYINHSTVINEDARLFAAYKQYAAERNEANLRAMIRVVESADCEGLELKLKEIAYPILNEQVGYPTALALDEVDCFESLLGFFMGWSHVTEENYEEMREMYNTILATSTVNLPVDGKAYTIKAVHINADGSVKNAYTMFANADGQVTASADADVVAAGQSRFIAKCVEGNKFILVNEYGGYLNWFDTTNGTKSYNTKGLTEAYDETYNQIVLEHATNSKTGGSAPELTDLQRFGCLQMSGHPKNSPSAYQYFCFDNGNNQRFVSGNSGDKYYNADGRHTFLFMMEEAEYAYNKPVLRQANGAYYSTIYLPFAMEVPENVKAYAVTEKYEANVDGTVTSFLRLAKAGETGTKLHSGAYILFTDDLTEEDVLFDADPASINRLVAPAAAAPEAYDGNVLFGSTNATADVADLRNPYVLSGKRDSNGVMQMGFYPYVGTEYPLGKAIYSAGSNVSAFKFSFGEDEMVEAIRTLERNGSDSIVIDLQGRVVSDDAAKSPARGIYIKNAKKVLAK